MKLFVVDDEPLIRKRLRETINWQEHGHQIVGEASNGLEAVQLFHQLRPDIVITDIRMPGLTGLELMKTLKESAENVKFIFLTGYSDFEYAQTAIKLGAFDFILKPTDETELLNVIHKAQIALETERNYRAASQAFQEEADDPLLKQMYLLYLIENDANTFSRQVDIREKLHGLYQILLIQADQINTLGEQELFHRLEQVSHQLDGVISSWRAADVKETIHFNLQNRTVLFILFDANTSLHVMEDHCRFAAEEIKLCLNDSVVKTVSIGMSEPRSDISVFNEVYKEADLALKDKFFKGTNVIIKYSEIIHASHEISYMNSSEKIDQIIQQIVAGSLTELHHEIELFFAQLKASSLTEGNIKTILLHLLQHIIMNLGPKYPDMQDFSKDFEIKMLILNGESLLDLKLIVLDFSNYLVDLIHSDARMEPLELKVSTGLTKEIMNYIKEHYHTDISLKSAAEHVYINPAYLCRAIKKDTGQNFTDIVTEYRIERAKDLLQDVRYKTYEVGEKVGFKYSRNFSVKFKQITGFTPTDFRNGAGETK